MLPFPALQPPCMLCGWPSYPLVRIDRALEILAVNGQVTIVRDDLENPDDVCIPGVCSSQP
jgi:hypothetical protein